MRQIVAAAFASAVLACPFGAAPAAAQAPAPGASSQAWTSNDYTRAQTWLCRPGQEDVCTTGLDAVRVDAAGARTPAPFQAAADPAIDCFYVYPTVSAEPTDFADMSPTAEVAHAAQAQAGRLASRCRLFVPLYRQLTGHGIEQALKGGAGIDWSRPYADVRDAWREYLAHDNGGRGVVLVGHSQGTILLQRLIAEEIDGKPAQALLVSAFLAGDQGLQTPAGARVGGTFRHVPLCSAAGETGCVYVWSSYAAADAAAARFFGRNGAGGLLAACVNPAAPTGGAGRLDGFLPRPRMAPETDPPYIEVAGQLSGECVRDAQGEVLRVSVVPGPYAELLTALLNRPGLPGWGLHVLDVSLVQENMLEDIDAQARNWRSPHGR